MLVACWCSFALLSADGTQANRWHNNVILESCAIHLSFVDDRHDDFSIIYISFYFGFDVWVASVAAWSYTLLLLFLKVSDHVCCRLSFGWCQRKCVCGFRFTYFICSHFSCETSSIHWRSHLRMLFLDCRLPLHTNTLCTNQSIFSISNGTHRQKSHVSSVTCRKNWNKTCMLRIDETEIEQKKI